MSALDPQAAIKRDTADVQVGPFPDLPYGGWHARSWDLLTAHCVWLKDVLSGGYLGSQNPQIAILADPLQREMACLLRPCEGEVVKALAGGW